MNVRLHKLCAEGDILIQWDTEDPVEIAKARLAVLALKNQGYSFFLADGSPAPDEVSAGGGSLTVRRIDVEEILNPTATDGASVVGAVTGTTEGTLPKRGRGGRKPAATPAPKDRVVVAARPNSGG